MSNVNFELRGDDLGIISSIKEHIPIEREDIWGWLCYLEKEILRRAMYSGDRQDRIMFENHNKLMIAKRKKLQKMLENIK